MRTAILGTGHYLPEKVVTNQQLTEQMDTSDAWIVQRTGIEQRHFVDFDKNPMGAAEMGARAARAALQEAQLQAADIEMIVYATLSPDKQFPGDGVAVQAKLDIPSGVPALDIRNQCTGFLYGLSVAHAFIQSGQYKHILLIGAECHSSGLDMSTRGRDVAVLFGDAAAAVVLGAGGAESSVTLAENGSQPVPASQLLSIQLHADGRFAEALHLSCPSSAQAVRLGPQDLAAGRQYPQMQGKTVFKHAVTRLPETVLANLQANNLSINQVDLFIFHQANLRINEMVAAKLGIPAARIFNNIAKRGNTTAASIPLAIHEARQQGRLKRGDLLCLAAFGAGFTWGSALLRF